MDRQSSVGAVAPRPAPRPPGRGGRSPRDPRVRARLPRGVRRAALVVHLVSGGTWIGVDVMVAVLAVVGVSASGAGERGAALQVLGGLVLGPMLGSALVCLASGVVLGLATPWGLVRHWWVLVKLVITLVLCVLVVALLRPGLPAVATAGRRLADGLAPGGALDALLFPPAVSLTALSVAVVLSVVKPWGTVRRRPGRRARRPAAGGAVGQVGLEPTTDGL